jgi:hypothetical protein
VSVSEETAVPFPVGSRFPRFEEQGLIRKGAGRKQLLCPVRVGIKNDELHGQPAGEDRERNRSVGGQFGRIREEIVRVDGDTGFIHP